MNRPNWIGQTLGNRYKIQEVIGQGGMSSVYKAIDPNLQRVVAIKLIHPHLSDDPKFTARFEEEARAVARLRHPNIVQVYDFNHDGDVFYMVQEFIPGETLQSLLRRLNQTGSRMPLNDAVQATIQICSAIGYSHQLGMIHRDIKPANIMIDERGQAILMDFGIVKLLEGEAHTTTGAVVGTVLYMSPELIRGEKPDPRSDMYSLGVTLFEMLSGRPPFEANSAMTLMMMHQNDPVPDLHQLRPDIPEDLISIVEKSLAKKREARFNSAAEMAAALKKVFDRLTRSGSVLSTRIEYPESSPVQLESATPTVKTRDEHIPSTGTDFTLKSPSPVGTTGQRAVPAGGAARITSAGVQSTSQTSPSKKRNMTAILAGGGLGGVLLLMICLVAGVFAFRGMLSNNPAETPAVEAIASATPVAVVAGINPSPTLLSTPIAAAPSTPSPTARPAVTSTPTAPPGVPFVRINRIATDSEDRYVVDYETFLFTEVVPGQHIHFFFDTVLPEQTGDPGQGSWMMHGGPRPFTGFKVTDRPLEAVQMCALVANPNHSVQLESGTCYPLPDVAHVAALEETVCRFGPGDEYPVQATLESGQLARAEGLSADENWWYVAEPGKPGSFCWVSLETTEFSGDIAKLRLVEPPPVPTGGPAISDAPFVEITGITLDSLSRFVTQYQVHNFQESLPGMHIHFFFDTTPPDQVGITGSGTKLMHGGPTPFSGFKASDRPPGAVSLCALAANPDHSIIAGSGNCFTLPAAVPGAVPTTSPLNASPKDPNY